MRIERGPSDTRPDQGVGPRAGARRTGTLLTLGSGWLRI